MNIMTIEEYQKAYPDGEIIHAINHIGRHKNRRAELNWIQARINASWYLKEYDKSLDTNSNKTGFVTHEEVERLYGEYKKWLDVAHSFYEQLDHADDWKTEAIAQAEDARDLLATQEDARR